jgi:hypothetical protein
MKMHIKNATQNMAVLNPRPSWNNLGDGLNSTPDTAAPIEIAHTQDANISSDTLATWAAW